jgi:hypothetical protein
LSPDKVGGQPRQLVGAILGPAIIERDVLAFDKARFLQAAMKRSQDGRGTIGRAPPEESNCWLLRPQQPRARNRGGGRCTAKQDELAPSHSITSFVPSPDPQPSSIRLGSRVDHESGVHPLPHARP